MHYLYLITNLINGKRYVGQTIQPEKRWYDHRRSSANPTQVIHYAIAKHGAHNFSFEVVASCKTQDDANELETALVSQYDTYIGNGKGYNVTLGGFNAPKTDAWKAAVSAANKGKRMSPATEFQPGHPKIYLGPHPNLGKTPWNKGLPPEKQSRFGAKLTEEHKAILINGSKKRRKLTQQQVSEIRSSTLSSAQLGREFGLSGASIRDILKHRTYKT